MTGDSATAATLEVAVLGAAGTIAPAIIRDLSESREVAALRLLDLDLAGATAAADEHGLGKARAVGVDARRGLASALEGCDVLVNAASYRINLDAMRSCLDAGCHYIDLGGLYWLTGEQLEMAPQFEAAGLLALLGMGSSPGKTNVMAALAVGELGERPRELNVMAAGRDLDPAPDGLSFPYALQTLVDEVTMSPVVIHDGEPREIDPLSSGGEVDFGPPIDLGETIHTLHSEMRTFPGSFGCERASFRLSLAPALLDRLRELSSAPPGEIAAAAQQARAPSAQTVSVHLVEAVGERESVRVRALTHPVPAWGLGGGVVSTGAPAAAAVRLLANRRIEARGALPPERCVSAADLFADLERRGTSIEVTRIAAPRGRIGAGAST